MRRIFFCSSAAAMAIVGIVVSAQAPTPSPTPKLAAPLRLALSSLVPDAKFDLTASAFAATEDAVWIDNSISGLVSRVDQATNKVIQSVSAGKDPCGGLVADFDNVLVAICGKDQLARIDPKKNALTEPITTSFSRRAHSFATGVGSVWVIADDRGTISRIDPANGEVVAQIYTQAGATALAFGEGALWAASPSGKKVTRINPHTNLIAETIDVMKEPNDIAVGEGGVWTWNRADGSVTRIDPKTNTVVTTVQSGAMGAEGRIVAGEGSVWVASTGVALTRIEPRTNRVAQIFAGSGVRAIAILNGSVWLGVLPGVVWRLDPKRIEATR